jgi:predicted enzyme related to lactoylglutathione lyase
MSGASIGGVSGVFIDSETPKALADWYSKTLGLAFHYWPERKSYGTEFIYDEGGGPPGRKSTVFVINPAHGKGGISGGFKVQFRVNSVRQLKAAVEKHGTKMETEDHPYGTFGRLRDAEGNTVELWEPK